MKNVVIITGKYTQTNVLPSLFDARMHFYSMCEEDGCNRPGTIFHPESTGLSPGSIAGIIGSVFGAVGVCALAVCSLGC